MKIEGVLESHSLKSPKVNHVESVMGGRIALMRALARKIKHNDKPALDLTNICTLGPSVHLVEPAISVRNVVLSITFKYS